MTFKNVLFKTEKFISDNSPTILTAIGVTGTITTAVLAGKASYKAGRFLQDEERYRIQTNKPALETRERYELVWKLYIPAIGVGVMTTSCIVAANHIGTRRAAAMAAAFSISEKAFEEYREKIVEKLGENKERAARDELAQERFTTATAKDATIIVTGGGEVLCMDAWSGRCFMSSMETMKKAQNDTNHEVLNHGYASLTDLYNRLGLARTKESDEVGWNSDKLLEMTFSTTISDDDRPCIVMDFQVAPVRNYFRTH